MQKCDTNKATVVQAEVFIFHTAESICEWAMSDKLILSFAIFLEVTPNLVVV